MRRLWKANTITSYGKFVQREWGQRWHSQNNHACMHKLMYAFMHECMHVFIYNVCIHAWLFWECHPYPYSFAQIYHMELVY